MPDVIAPEELSEHLVMEPLWPAELRHLATS
jgi:hypothetical protein